MPLLGFIGVIGKGFTQPWGTYVGWLEEKGMSGAR